MRSSFATARSKLTQWVEQVDEVDPCREVGVRAARLEAYEVLGNDEVRPGASAGTDREKDIVAGPYAELGLTRLGERPYGDAGPVGGGRGTLGRPLLLGDPGTQKVAPGVHGRPVGHRGPAWRARGLPHASADTGEETLRLTAGGFGRCGHMVRAYGGIPGHRGAPHARPSSPGPVRSTGLRRRPPTRLAGHTAPAVKRCSRPPCPCIRSSE